MNKTKLIGLSLLAFSAVSIMASCSGGKPASKPDVYFRAQAAVLDTVDGETVSKIVDYKNTECAEMTVADKENLRYGAQDVVITIKPKKFFTFRKYKVGTWEAENLPVRPYVGLGNPHALYNYPLQENVAWTFKDNSKPYKVGDQTFYSEEYVITVKKEFFQKNIVIDYGNTGSLNNNVYVYNSQIYETLFKAEGAITGSYKDFYEVESSASSFVVANKNAIITYGIKDNDNGLYNFDSSWTEPKKSSNDKVEEYEHFKIWSTKEGEDPVNIATHDPSVDEKEQKFVPEVSSNGQYLTFTIDWRLLADEKTYDNKFNKIQVEFIGAPNITCVDSVTFEGGEYNKFKCDFFQYTDPTNLSAKAPFSKDGTLSAIDESDTEPAKVEFANVLATNGLQDGESIKYSTLFQLTSDNKEYFSVTINKDKLIDVDINNPQHMTNWRVLPDPEGEKSTPIIEGETEVPYWTDADETWYLVQLNPEGRTYGLNKGDEQFIGGQNLYYLYTLDTTDLTKQLTIEVEYTTVPKYVNFVLDDTSKTLGTLSDTKVRAVDKTSVDLKFIPSDTAPANIDVALDAKHASDFKATYVHGTSSYSALIRIESINEATFEENDTFTITLTEGASSMYLVGQSNKIGQFMEQAEDGSWNPKTDNSLPAEAIGKNEMTVYFQFKDKYFEDEYFANNFYHQTLHNGTTANFSMSKAPIEGTIFSITITLQGTDTFKATGDVVDFVFSYIRLKLNDSTKEQLLKLTIADGVNLGYYVGTQTEKVGGITVSGAKDMSTVSFGVYSEDSEGLDVNIDFTTGKESTDIVLMFRNLDKVGSITNGMTIVINAFPK